MKIKKLITINWANLENREFILDDLVFLTGQTGVGKSTFLDAIQTVLTGAMDKVVNYNAGQDESQTKTKGKEYRSLGGYILGEDRELYSRPSGAIGTIVLTFVSTKNENNKIFNAIVNVKCSMEEIGKKRKAVIDETNFFIVNDEEIFLKDLLDNDKVLLGNDLFNNIEKNPLFSKEKIKSENRKGHYLTLLYGQLWGIERAPLDKAKKAAKAFAKFIYARPVNNINKFVRDEFLEDKNMDAEITRLSNALSILKDIKDQADIIEYGILELDKFSKHINNIMVVWKENIKLHLFHAAYKKDFAEQEEKSFQTKIQKEDLDISKKLSEVEQIKIKIKDLKKVINPLIMKRDSNEVYQNIERINKDIEDNISNISEIKKDLIQTSNKLSTNIYDDIYKITKSKFDFNMIGDFNLLYEKIDYFSKLNLSEMLPILISVSSQIEQNRFKEPYDIIFPLLIEIENILKVIINNMENSQELESFQSKFSSLSEKELTSSKKILLLEQRIKTLKNKEIVCPDMIQHQFNQLKAIHPDISMSMLYRHIDIKLNQEKWAYSIEGFLKNNRFAIIVPVGYELLIVDTIKNNKLNYLKVIQSTKMIEDLKKTGSVVKENSIINKLIIDDEISKAYLIRNYRNVLCYENEQELKFADRGISKDYKAVNGGIIFFCKAEELYFGENARLQQIITSEEELIKAKNEFNKAADELAAYRIINKIITHNLPKLKFESEKLSYEFDTTYNKYLNNKKLLSTLNTNDFKKLNEQIEKLEEKCEILDEQRIQIEATIIDLTNKINNRNSEQNYINNQIEKTSKLYNDKEKEFINIMQLIEPNYILDNLNIKSNLLENEPENLKLSVTNNWTSFIEIYIKSDVFKYKEIYYEANDIITEIKVTFDDYKTLLSEYKKIISELSRLKNTIQSKYKSDIEKGEKKVKEVFVEGFCVTMNRNIKNCKLEIDKFSTMLSEHKFEKDQFLMVTLDADPEYEEFKTLFKEIAENGNLFEIANKENLELTKNNLLEKFQNIGKNRNELMRIADYRNYSKYDILQIDEDGREISLSKNAKNSGGQGETSYYVIRSINLHSALNPKVIKKGFTLETVLIDESFVKSNDDRAKEIISYLNRTLDYQVIAALPTKGANELLRTNCSNYNITKLAAKTTKRGELDYVAWSRYSNNNAEAINRIIEAEQPSLFNEASIEGASEYDQLTKV